jgi:glyoxylase-like metal-dependent hydrolase (beta-lactamase superfamily II)
MPGWLKTTLSVLVALIVVLSAAFYWFFLDPGRKAVSGQFHVDMAQIRALADGDGSAARPTDIRVERVATAKAPQAALVTGAPWTPTEMVFLSYQLVFPDRSIIIDTALDGGLAKSMDTTGFDAQAYGRMTAAMDKAEQIALTHEHIDHIGGIARSSHVQQLIPALRITVEQMDHPEKMGEAKITRADLPGYQPLAYDRYYLLAPGVVLIKAPGHTPGSQMVYIHRADGAEILLLGDIAWHMRSVEQLRPRPRAISQFMLKEDRDAVIDQLAEIQRLGLETPQLAIVPGHDPAVIDRLIANGTLLATFN